jgi:hypothetical protein
MLLNYCYSLSLLVWNILLTTRRRQPDACRPDVEKIPNLGKVSWFGCRLSRRGRKDAERRDPNTIFRMNWRLASVRNTTNRWNTDAQRRDACCRDAYPPDAEWNFEKMNTSFGTSSDKTPVHRRERRDACSPDADARLRKKRRWTYC